MRVTLGCLFTLLALVAATSTAPTTETVSNQSVAKRSFKKCSRPHSKMVREYFVRVLLPIFQKYSVPVPEKCPFSPLYDIYHYHENNKTKLDTNIWKCEICGKKFMEEKYLDKHFDQRHSDSLQNNQVGVCLANYCRIFRCDVLMNPSLSGPQNCYESTMTTLRNKCQSHIELCIPRGVPYSTQNKLQTELRESLCSYLTCSRFHDLPAYMSTGPSFLVIFCIVVFVGLCIIAYGVINHTDLIYDESYDVSMSLDSKKVEQQSESSSQERKECPMGCCKKHKCGNNTITKSSTRETSALLKTDTQLRHRHSHNCH